MRCTLRTCFVARLAVVFSLSFVVCRIGFAQGGLPPGPPPGFDWPCLYYQGETICGFGEGFDVEFSCPSSCKNILGRQQCNVGPIAVTGGIQNGIDAGSVPSWTAPGSR